MTTIDLVARSAAISVVDSLVDIRQQQQQQQKLRPMGAPILKMALLSLKQATIVGVVGWASPKGSVLLDLWRQLGVS